MHANRLLVFAIALLSLGAAGLAHTQTASAAELLYAVDSQNRLISFSSATPSSIARIAFTGLPAGEEILGLDQRPANKTLVAVGRSSRLYNVNPTTGAATAIGAAAFAPALSGASFGFDFNPTVDRIRLTSDARQDLRLHPDTGATAATDGTLTYAPGDPGASATPRVVASAYTNSTAGATTTQLFDLDAGRDVLALQNPPNNGTLTTIGPLGVDASDLAGFDISGVDGIAYAALQVGGASSSSLYTINLASGAATAVGRIGGGSIVRALAGAGTALTDSTAPSVQQLTVSAATRVGALLRSGVRVGVACSEGCTASVRLIRNGRTVGSAAARTIDLAGNVSLRAVFTSASKKSLTRVRSVTITVVVTVRDAAGNTVTNRRTIRAKR